MLEDRNHRTRYALAALFKRRCASDPEKYLRVRVFGQSLDVQTFGPVGAGECGSSPGVASLLHAKERVHGRLRHLRLFHDEVAAHVYDGVDVFHAYRTLLHAGPARQAVPERLRLNPIADERLFVLLILTLSDARPGLKNVLFEVLDDVHGREDFATDVCRAVVGAATTDGA